MKIALIIIVILILVVTITYIYFGGFKTINIQITTQGGETVVYEDIIGDYRQSGIVMDKVYHSLLDNDNIETFKGFGKYFDNPKEVAKEDLRSMAGSIVEEKDTAKLKDISGEFKIMKLPVQKYITTEFPYKGRMSVLFSIMKVYPALNRYTEDNGFENNTPVIEIYDIPNRKILYRKELINRE